MLLKLRHNWLNVLLLFFLVLPISYGFDFVEEFDTVCSGYNTDLTNFTTTAVTTNWCASSNGIWYFYDLDRGATTDGNTRLNFSQYYLSKGNAVITDNTQLVVSTDASSNDDFAVVGYEFSDVIEIRNDTLISYYGNTSNPTDAGVYDVRILFTTGDGDCKILYGYDDFINSSICYGSLDYKWYSNLKGLNLSNGNQPANQEYNFSAIPNKKISGISRMYILFSTTMSANTAILDQFSIEDYYNGTNLLPYFNVSVDDPYRCILLNDTFPYIIELNWSTYDKESDTILYGTGIRNYQTQESIDFTTWDNEFNIYLDYTDLLNFDASCGIFLVETTNESRHKAVQGYDEVNDPAYLLNLNGDCTNTDKTVTHIWKAPSISFNYDVGINDLDSGEELNISVLSSTLEKGDYEFIITLNRTNSDFDFDILLNNGSKYNLYNFTSTKSDFRFSMFNTVDNGDIYGFKFYYSNNGISLDTTTYVNDVQISNPLGEYKGTLYSIGSGDDVYLSSIYNNLFQYNITWSSTQPSNVTFYRPMYKEIRFYVSDDAHSTSEYNYESVFVSVVQEDYCYDPINVEDDINLIIGNSFKGYFDFIGQRDKAITFLYVFFVLLFVFFIVMTYLANHTISILIPLVLSSVISLIFAVLLNSGIQIISFIITGMIGVAGLVNNSHN